MDDDVETESLLDDEILSLLGGCRSWVGVAPGWMSLSAGRRGRRRRALSGAVCVSAGVRVGLLAGRLCVRGAPTAWRGPKGGYDVGGVQRISGVTA
mgnify:CR=1 FL=1